MFRLMFSFILLGFSFSSCVKEVKIPIPSVVTDSGYVVFYSNDGGQYSIDVNLNNEDIGRISSSTSTVPVCGALAVLTVKYPIGNYPYFATMLGSKLWEGSITVKKDSCHKIFLNRYDASVVIATPVDSFFRFTLNNIPVYYTYPWWGRLYGDAYTSSSTSCIPYFGGAMKLRLKARNDYRENQTPYVVPPGACSAAPRYGENEIEFNIRMNNRPIVGQQFTSCTNLLRFSLSFGTESVHYGYYGIESPGDYINVTITNVTGHTVSGIFQGSLTKYRMAGGCVKIITGRGEITNGSFYTKYKFN